MRIISRISLIGLLVLPLFQAEAGVFNLPRFVSPGFFAVGIEPELTLTNHAGLGVNFKYTHGLTDISNVTAIIGTGGGTRGFRAGGSISFDFFPDIEKQPGIGLAVQPLYWRLNNEGWLELSAIPYIHKAFATSGGEVEPFLALPFGFAFSQGNYKNISTFAVGASFKNTEKLRYVLEVGVAINETDSYVSGGVVYYY